jgi:hypothetical protein
MARPLLAGGRIDRVMAASKAMAVAGAASQQAVLQDRVLMLSLVLTEAEMGMRSEAERGSWAERWAARSRGLY